MPAAYVDFSLVKPEHREIDARLANWAKWSYSRHGGQSSPTFRLYRSTDARRIDSDAKGPAVDAIDAQRVQKAVSALPTKHRQAISWAYIKPTNPRKAATGLGVTLQGLADLVTDGRQMLVNRGA